MRAALGWELFKKFLTVHHTTEDDVLWPTLRAQVAAQPNRLALATRWKRTPPSSTPLLTAIDAAAATRTTATSDSVTSPTTRGQAHAHLTHEENDGLALIGRLADPQQWQHFAHTTATPRRRRVDVHALAANGASPDPGRGRGNFPPSLLAATASSGPQYAP